MANTSATIASVDSKLEQIVSIMVRMADEQAEFRREFVADMAELKETVKQQALTAQQQAETARQQSESVKQQAEAIKQQAESIKQQAEMARIQSESVRDLVKLFNQKQAS
jgi:methyl-accepting chemotaxis protein